MLIGKFLKMSDENQFTCYSCLEKKFFESYDNQFSTVCIQCAEQAIKESLKPGKIPGGIALILNRIATAHQKYLLLKERQKNSMPRDEA